MNSKANLKGVTYAGSVIFILLITGLKSPAQFKQKESVLGQAGKTFTIKVSQDMHPEVIKLLDGKIIKEGDNKFTILSSDHSLNFIVKDGQFSKCLAISRKATNIKTRDITKYRKAKDSKDVNTDIVNGCWLKYLICNAQCDIAGLKFCNTTCDVELFDCVASKSGSISLLLN